MSSVIRAVADADLENMSPHMIFCIFVAARFYLGTRLIKLLKSTQADKISSRKDLVCRDSAKS
jgi:hypothetical protein